MRNEKITPLYERLSRDEEAAEMVRRIFSLTMEGYGPYQISKLLSEAKVEIPAVHLARFDEGVNRTKPVKDPYGWGSSTIVNILKKREYLGHTINFKTRKHFKDKKSHYVDESEWTIFENTHEAIIDQETFDNVQRIRAEAVLTLITDMLRAIAEYSKNDRAEFIRTVQETQAAQQTADISKNIALIDKYENFDTLTNTMLNEFVEKILVHERARKGSQDTTQEVEIYFNFVGRYIPPALQPVPLTPEEQEELRKKEERKDRLHQNYLRRKANGKQKEWEERYNAKRKAQVEAAGVTEELKARNPMRWMGLMNTLKC